MFTPAAAAALDGPDWLRATRVAAAERVEGQPLPTAAEEIWRYSRVDELELDRFALAPSEQSGPAVSRSLHEGASVTVRNGRVVAMDIAPDLVAAGVRIGRVSDLDASSDAVGAVMAEATDVFAELNTAFSEPIVLRVPRGLVVDRPLVVHHLIDAAGAAVFPRLIVQAEADSQVVVVEETTSDEVVAFVAPVVEIDARPASRVQFVGVNRLANTVWQIASHVTRADRDASIRWSHVALGGDYARVRTDARLVGPGASGEQIALYFGEADQMHDVRTLQDHVAPRTTSNLLFKGAVEGHSRSVYSGLIRIGKDARNCSAFQTNRNITLSEGAWAESVPNLDIQNNEVRCSHASAVGPIDEDQRFYLASRGIPPAVADRLIVLGFFDEVLSQLPVPSLIPVLRAEVAAKLDRRGADR